MRQRRIIRGFTLLEVLTAMAIVALMIGLLIPAIGTIKNTAGTVKQKAQFNAIEIALETFQADTGDYPPSSYTDINGSLPGNAVTDGYCGSMKLAEAIVGLDGFGFHPKSQWRPDRLQAIDTNGDGTPDTYKPLYYGAAGYAALTPAQIDENIKARKGPYVELEKANAIQLSSLYPFGHDIYNHLRGDAFVLCDMFGMNKNLGTGKKTGMPILYFRADTNNRLHVPTTVGDFSWETSSDAIYNVNENYPFFAYNPPWGNVTHPITLTGRSVFYNRIRNPNYTNPVRPYRAQSFILLSAGADGLYGTSDDVYNVDENDK